MGPMVELDVNGGVPNGDGGARANGADAVDCLVAPASKAVTIVVIDETWLRKGISDSPCIFDLKIS